MSYAVYTVVDYVHLDAPAKFGDSRLNSGPIIRLFGRPDVDYALLFMLHVWSCLCLFCLLHFAADRKELVTSYPAGLCRQLFVIRRSNFVNLG